MNPVTRRGIEPTHSRFRRPAPASSSRVVQHSEGLAAHVVEREQGLAPWPREVAARGQHLAGSRMVRGAGVEPASRGSKPRVVAVGHNPDRSQHRESNPDHRDTSAVHCHCAMSACPALPVGAGWRAGFVERTARRRGEDRNRTDRSRIASATRPLGTCLPEAPRTGIEPACK